MASYDELLTIASTSSGDALRESFIYSVSMDARKLIANLDAVAAEIVSAAKEALGKPDEYADDWVAIEAKLTDMLNKE